MHSNALECTASHFILVIDSLSASLPDIIVPFFGSKHFYGKTLYRMERNYDDEEGGGTLLLYPVPPLVSQAKGRTSVYFATYRKDNILNYMIFEYAMVDFPYSAMCSQSHS